MLGTVGMAQPLRAFAVLAEKGGVEVPGLMVC